MYVNTKFAFIKLANLRRYVVILIEMLLCEDMTSCTDLAHALAYYCESVATLPLSYIATVLYSCSTKVFSALYSTCGIKRHVIVSKMA